jgi:putative PIN family toxin of toxin-antitoxin system
VLRVVLDVNIVVSGMLWTGPSQSLLGLAASHQYDLLSTEEIISSLLSVASRPKFAIRMVNQSIAPADIESRFRSVAQIVAPVAVVAPDLRDSDDIAVLRCAVGGQADMIVTGDHDLLVLREFEGIAIVRPGTAVNMFPPGVR